MYVLLFDIVIDFFFADEHTGAFEFNTTNRKSHANILPAYLYLSRSENIFIMIFHNTYNIVLL